MHLKKILTDNNQQLLQAFNKNVDIHLLLNQRSDLIDSVLIQLWGEHLTQNTSASLIAVGGYGRREMHPASDIDLLILLNSEPEQSEQELLSTFIASLWNLGLDIGHSVRTFEECIEEAKKDLTVITNLMESRFLTGNQTLFKQLQQAIEAKELWSSDNFFTAKLDEQKKRYKHYGDSSYRVEPNLKEGPGGLRDIQMIDWIIQRQYGTSEFSVLADEHIISEKELSILINGRNYLWKVRFVLHQLAGRKEDRLLFNYQRSLAKQFGYTGDDKSNQCIESFMQRYYRTITALERITEVILGLLREGVFNQSAPIIKKINSFYLNRNGYLSIADETLFQKYPHTLLEVFHLLQITPHIIGMSPDTIRAIRANLHLINHDFRHHPLHKELFMKIISESRRITFVLHRMNRYGVLAAYLPAFANIVGRMQYDLFHAYTVDEHTLKVIRHVRRLSTNKGEKKFPLCSHIFQTLDNPEILYLAALFHDIAKGRGGSHARKGAEDALTFCLSHEMNTYAAKTVSWLVEKHLLMSSIAQRKDISDEKVIKQFADTVSLSSRLDYLYLLTVCDISATNETLLNNWKHALLKELYQNTHHYLLNKGTITPKTEVILEEKKQSLQAKLFNISVDSQQQFLNRLSNDYVLHTPIDILLWHIDLLANNKRQTVVSIQQDLDNNSSTLLFIYAKNCDDFFVRITSAIEKQRLDIVAARIHFTNDNKYPLVTLHLLNSNGKPISDDDDIYLLQEAVEKSLCDQQPERQLKTNPQHYRIPRQLKYFDTPTRVSYSQDEARQQTVITLITADQPGLLTHISQVFYEHGIHLHSARIATLGEEVEDIFHITLENGLLLDNIKQQKILEFALQKRLASFYKQ